MCQAHSLTPGHFQKSPVLVEAGHVCICNEGLRSVQVKSNWVSDGSKELWMLGLTYTFESEQEPGQQEISQYICLLSVQLKIIIGNMVMLQKLSDIFCVSLGLGSRSAAIGLS
ncbi:uncharacterized protein LOC144291971 [Canis aureus]